MCRYLTRKNRKAVRVFHHNYLFCHHFIKMIVRSEATTVATNTRHEITYLEGVAPSEHTPVKLSVNLGFVPNIVFFVQKKLDSFEP